MSDQVPKEEQAGILGTLAGWGEAIYSYAADSVSGYVPGCAHRCFLRDPTLEGHSMMTDWC